MADKMKALWKGEYEDLGGEDGTEHGRRPAEFLLGVPARSLTQDDWDALSPELQEACRASKLYDVRTEAEMRESPPAERAGRSKPAEEE